MELSFIVFLLDSKFKEHDGMVFNELKTAKEFCVDVIESKYADKIIIGQFVFDKDKKQMIISCIETFGFKKDKTNFKQLSLFN